MTTQKFDPVREFTTFRDSVSRAFGQSIQSASGNLYPLVDIYETADAIVVRTAPLNGKLESVEVTMEDDLLIITGETKSEDTIAAEAYLQRERRFGKFSRAVRISRSVNAEEAQAQFKKGVLTITMPKAEDSDPQIVDEQPTE